MREIEFRGKQKTANGFMDFFLNQKQDVYCDLRKRRRLGLRACYLPETVCEYTGLKDVYENDYCEMYYNGKKEFSGLVKHKVCGFWLTNVLVYNGNKSFATNDLDLGFI